MKLNYVMLSTAELEILRRRARRGWVCFGLGLVMCSAGVFHLGRQTGYDAGIQRVEKVAKEQHELGEGLTKAWESHQAETNLVIGAAKTIRERDEMVRYNQENMCPDLQKAWAKRK